MKAVCPGSFDPVTLGHVDVVRRAAAMFDEVVVAVAVNPNKQGTFSVDERRELIAGAVGDLPNVSTAAFTGLLVDWCREQGVGVIAKGLRSDTDYAYELPMAQMNRHLTGVDTVFLTADPAHTFVSSSLVKEVARGGGDVSAFLTPGVLEALTRRLAEG
ncbi:pantetheine-phosphate adenylyltransferase [Actinomycetospora endophytica]|uniref:Phosphopantetheine adenylyltransferase n=1 Tax=Actinomycetospora endophytica TaxID=2291215 RepID=A0ABS8PFR0_9PSEU|nr:pantetheine-phosphate adenylyltransferase [Actinomycetospora endophytica]MCD2197100.1 pantetheine-phosphate adenylyltransferase [Actinomycetospora endophytica]